MNKLRICQRGWFASEFIVTDDNQSYSIGDYIEAVLVEPPYTTGELFTIPTGYAQVPIVAMRLTVTESCQAEPIEVVMERPPGRGLSHWMRCMEVGKISTIVPVRFTHCGHVWYMPKIDGMLPGLFGPVKAPVIGSE
jgi:hypothetical protein